MQAITATYNGLLLGDGSNYYLSHLDPGELPNREADQLAAGRDGGFIFNQNYGFRDIIINLNLFSPTDAQFFTDVRALRRAFSRSNTPRELVINYWDGSQRRIDCFVYQFPDPQHEPGMTAESTATIVLRAAWPFYKGDASQGETAHLTLTQSLGFDYPVTYPFDYLAGGSNNLYTFVNNGDADALIKVVFNSPVINPTLTNLTTGQFVQIATTLAGNSVTLEYTNNGRSIVDSSGNSYEVYFNGETAFFFIPVGTYTFSFTAATYDPNASCDITLTKYFLS